MTQLALTVRDVLPGPIVRRALGLRYLRGRAMRRRLASQNQLPEGFRRIYFHHVRKTAGTSLCHAFFGLDGGDPLEIEEEIYRSGHGWGNVGGRVIVPQSRYLAEEGFYFFAYSHAASHEVRLPPETFEITILRDPVKRVISHYRNLVHYQRHFPGTVHLRHEGRWLGASFGEFLDRIPQEHLLRQLYMFSNTFDVNEAFDRITALNEVMLTEHFAAGLAMLAQRLNIPLTEFHAKSQFDEVHLEEDDVGRLREMLTSEYRLIEKLRVFSC